MKKEASSRTLWVPLIIVAASSAAWLTLYGMLDQPSAQESLNIFLSVDAYDAAIETSLKDAFEAGEVTSVSVTALAASDTYYAATLATVGVQDCDLLVLPETILEGLGDLSDFAPLTTAALSPYGLTRSDYTYYDSGALSYGLEVYNPATSINLLADWMTFPDQDTYYVLINTNTVNAGTASVSTGPLTDHAWTAFAWMILHGHN